MHTLLWDGWWWFFFAVFKFVQVGIDRTVDVGFDPMTWWMREEKKKRNNNYNNLSIEDSIAVGIVIYSFSLLFPPPPPFERFREMSRNVFFLFYFFVSLSLFSPSLMIPYSRYQVQFMEFLFYFFFFIFQSSRSSHWVIFPFRNNFFFFSFFSFFLFFFLHTVYRSISITRTVFLGGQLALNERANVWMKMNEPSVCVWNFSFLKLKWSKFIQIAKLFYCG